MICFLKAARQAIEVTSIAVGKKSARLISISEQLREVTHEQQRIVPILATRR